MDHAGGAYEGLTEIGHRGRPRWNGKVRLVPELLEQPKKWKSPSRVFVNSMSDLFHEDVPPAFIAEVYKTMHLCPQHTFQVLTKRPDRAEICIDHVRHEAHFWTDPQNRRYTRHQFPNVWLGASAEDQETYDTRFPSLYSAHAAVHWLSLEPLLGPISLRLGLVKPDWVVVGGESGMEARKCDIGWIFHIVGQCQKADVPVFVKQLGSDAGLKHAKGGDPSEWPEDLRVREYPEGIATT